MLLINPLGDKASSMLVLLDDINLFKNITFELMISYESYKN